MCPSILISTARPAICRSLEIVTLSGTNTGDQTITLTGEVTGSGTGSFAATIADSVSVTGWTLTTPTISGAVTFPDDVRQTFNPGSAAAGLNVGSQAGDPSTPSNGDIWYDSTANTLDARINGATVNLGTGGAGGAPTTVNYLVGTADGTLSAEIVVGTTPGGELGGTWASPTLDDGVTVDAWVMGASTATFQASSVSTSSGQHPPAQLAAMTRSISKLAASVNEGSTETLYLPLGPENLTQGSGARRFVFRVEGRAANDQPQPYARDLGRHRVSVCAPGLHGAWPQPGSTAGTPQGIAAHGQGGDHARRPRTRDQEVRAVSKAIIDPGARRGRGCRPNHSVGCKVPECRKP